MAVIGIDLGTTYSAVARFVDGASEIILLEGNPTLPSVASVLPNGKIAVGWTAKRNQARNPQDTIIEVKRQMGEVVKVPLGQKEFTPQEISAMILKRIKELSEEQLGEDIDGVVISCPAYFKDPQRQATKEAGQIAGLNVLRIVNEPTAAAFAYGLGQAGDNAEHLAMVYDLGGGTFDVTVIKMISGSLEVIGTGGDPQLGGGNFDDRIVEWMMERIREKNPGYASTLTEERERTLRLRLKSHAEDAKKKLCGPPALPEYRLQIANVDQFEGKPVVFNEVLTMDEFESRIKDLLENSMKWLDVAMEVPKEKYKYTENDITDVLLVGGSTRVPFVRKMLEARYGPERLKGMEYGIDPDEIVARGASMVAAQADPYSTEVVESKLIDVTGHTLSVAVLDERRNREILHPLIPKETPIPTSAAHDFQSLGNFQTQVLVKVYQGEGEEIEGNQEVMKIGEFYIELPPIQDPIPLEIGLQLDKNGLLVAHASDRNTGRQVKCEINYSDSAQMRPEELKQKQSQLAAQLEQVVGRSANPLEQPSQPAPGAAQSWAQPGRPAQPIETQTGAGSMGAFAQALVEKAMKSFDRVPTDRRMAVMQAVNEVQVATQSGDQARLMMTAGQLAKLLEGID
jgi:molecular chaperone DnaK